MKRCIICFDENHKELWKRCNLDEDGIIQARSECKGFTSEPFPENKYSEYSKILEFINQFGKNKNHISYLRKYSYNHLGTKSLIQIKSLLNKSIFSLKVHSEKIKGKLYYIIK